MTTDLLAYVCDGSRPLPLDRDTLGGLVRDAWIRWAETQPSPKPSWLVSYDELPEADKEADRQIGEAIARWTLIHDAAAIAMDARQGGNAEERSHAEHDSAGRQASPRIGRGGES